MAGRPKAYNRSDVIQTATRLFWAKGYAGTSLTDLTAAMHLSKSSFYTAFSSKDALFNLCLETYGKAFFKEMVLMVTADQPVLDSIRVFFLNLAREHQSSHGTRGCLLVKSANEIGMNHPNISPVLTRLLRIAESTFRNALELAKRRDELPPSFDADRGATFLLLQLCGLRTLVHAHFPVGELEKQVDRILLHLRIET
jgi:TetR/AcrR family transcriptional regulator, transcriptional repressor for nem operon